MRYLESWLFEYEDFKRKELLNNNGIYDIFNKQQLDVIYRYFRWRTKMKFRKICNDTSLEAKPDKAEVLVNIMGGATDWVYDGCVDTGYMGGGQCELGHRLRYEHYAYSPSLDKAIKFGINCASDFFGLSTSKIASIQKAQAETLEEIKFIVFIRRTGKAQEYVNLFYRDLPDIVDTLGEENIGKTIGDSWFSVMVAFMNNRIPYTETLIKRLEWVKDKYYNKACKTKGRIKSLKEQYRDRKDIQGLLKVVEGCNGECTYYTRLLLDNLVRCENTFKVNDEFKSLSESMVGNAVILEELLNSIKNKYSNIDLVALAKRCTCDVVMIKDKDTGENRLATIEEKDGMVSGCFARKISIKGDAREHVFNLLWALEGDSSNIIANGMGNKVIDDAQLYELYRINNCLPSLNSWLQSIYEDANKALKPVLDFIDKTTYKHGESIDEGTATENVDTIIEYLEEHCPKNSGYWLYDLVNDILNKYRRYHKLSFKQRIKIREAYDRLHGQSNSNTVNTKFSERQIDAIKKAEFMVSMEKNIKDNSLSGEYYDKALSICNYVLNHKDREVSDKQYYVISKAYECYNKYLELKDGRDAIESDDRYEDKTDKRDRDNEYSSLYYFDDMQLVDRDNDIGDTRDVNMNDFNDLDDYEREVRDLSAESIDDVGDGIGMGLPNLIAVSNALGTGRFTLDLGLEGTD